MSSVPKRVIEASLAKWNRGLKACRDEASFIDWWEEEGHRCCSFCARYHCDTEAGQSEGDPCPLHVEGSVTCAPEWDKLCDIVRLYESVPGRIYIEEIRSLVEAMIARIKALA